MSTALLCLMVFCNDFSLGAFAPLLPEIARGQGLADWQLGILAGAFGFARTVLAVPVGRLAGRHLAATLVAGPLCLLVGVLLLGSAGPVEVLVAGRVLIGAGHAFGMVGGLTALLQRADGAGLRLNIFEFCAILGILGGLAITALVPPTWSWNRSLLVASSPQLAPVALLPIFWRRFSHGRPSNPRRRSAEAAAGAPPGWPPVVAAMFVVGALIAIAWSSVSQFLIPLRGSREFGLDRAANSRILAVSQVVDLVALLPVGLLADRLGQRGVLGAVCLVLGIGTLCVGVGSFPLFVLGSVLFGLGMAGWMLPMGVIREQTPVAALGWRMGLYRLGVDGGMFLGPLVSGFLTDVGAAYFVATIGLVTAAVGVGLLLRPRR